MAKGRIAGITIEIGADTSKLTKAFNDVNKSLKTTGKDLKDVDKLLKLNPGNVELLTQKQEYLTKAIEDTKKKLETEKEALKKMKEGSTTDEVTEEQKALAREIQATEGDLKDLVDQYKEFGTVSGQQIQAAGEHVQQTGQSMQQVGKDMTTHVTMPIVAGFTAAIKTTADFDGQMSRVEAITGATGDEMDTMRKKAREMGAKTKFSATEAGEAMEYMGMAGWKTGDIVDGLDGIMNLAAASGEDLGTTSDIVTDAMTAFGLEAKSAGHFADVLAAASTNSNTNVGMLGESFKYVAPVAGAMGYSVEDTATALGLMANAGIKSSSAGTALRNVMTRMAKPTKESEAAMSRLGLSLTNDNGEMKSFREIMDDMRKGFGQINMPVEDFNARVAELDAGLEDGTVSQKEYDKELEELIKQAYGAEGAEKARAAAMLAGKQGMSGLLAIVNASTEDYNKLTNAIDTSSESVEGYSGQAEKMAATMQDNLNGQLTILKSQLEELAISFGEIAMPAVREFTGFLQKAVDFLNNLSPAQKEAIAKFAALAAAIGPVVLVGGKVVSGVGSMISVFGKLKGAIGVAKAVGAAGKAGGVIGSLGGLVTAAGPILAGGAVVAGVVAGGVLIYKNWDKIKESAGKLATTLSTKWGEIKTKTAETWKGVKDAVSTKLGEAKTAVTTKAGEIAASIKTKFETAKTNATTAFTNLGNSIKTKFETAKTNITTTAGNIASTIKTKLETAKTNAVTAFTNLGNDIKTKFETAKGNIETVAGNIASAIKTKFETAKKNAGDAFKSIGNDIKTKFEKAKTNIATTAGNIANDIKTNLSTAAKNAKESFKTIASDAKDKVAAAFNDAKDKLSGLTSGLSGINSRNFANVATNIAAAAKNKFGEAFESATSFVSDFTQKLNSFSPTGFMGTLSKAGSALQTNVADKVSKVWSTLSSIKNNFQTFKIQFPKITLPHFELQKGQVTILGRTFTYPKGFSVRWYKKAYDNPIMFTNPTVLQTPSGLKGFGDGNGGEIVLSDKKLREIAGGGATYTINVYGAEGQSVNALADAVQRRLVALQRQKEAAGLA